MRTSIHKASLRYKIIPIRILLSCCIGILCSCTKSSNINEPPPIIRGPGGCTKVCQLVGNMDLQTGQPVINQTLSQSGIYGSDLGVSFEHNEKLWFLFGDTVGTSMADEDAIAFSSDNDPDDCVVLNFLTDNQNKWIPPTVPTVSLGAFEVPMEGISAQGMMYVYFTTDHSEQHTMGRSILARSDDDGQTFSFVTTISDHGKFINISAEVVDTTNMKGLPTNDGQGIFFWGSGEFRQSGVSLAFQPLSQIENPGTISYFSGTTNSLPTWSSSEEDAVLLVKDQCVGELSVTYNPHLNKFIMTYNCGYPRGILFRTAESPWGPWSAPGILFDPIQDQGYCHFMHVSYLEKHCDTVFDAMRENETGGEYGPYQIAPFAKAIPNGSSIYFTMSTWNPYTVVLMRADLINRE